MQNIIAVEHAIQREIGTGPSRAVVGDWASGNPRIIVAGGEGGWRAGPRGVLIGRFAWADDGIVDPDGTAVTVTNHGGIRPLGFVHRAQQGLITEGLEAASMLIPAGMNVSICSHADCWCANDGGMAAEIGYTAYTNSRTGEVVFGEPADCLFTAGIAPEQATAAGSIVDNILEVEAITAGELVVGSALSGAGIEPRTRITGQIAADVFTVNVPHDRPAGPFVASYAMMTINQIEQGEILVGHVFHNGRGLGNVIRRDLGGGIFLITPSQTIPAGRPMGSSFFISTKWSALSSAGPGEIVRITGWALG